MADISASMVKELREKSGAAMMDCKKALVETSGDFEKAFEWLRQKGVAVATKKSSREALEGIIVGKVSGDGKQGIILEVNCETDFVARNEEFIQLANELAHIALTGKCKNVEALMQQKHAGGTVEQLVTAKVAKTGENIVVRRLTYMELPGAGLVGLYIHALGGKMGALVKLESSKNVDNSDSENFAKELAMHIVAQQPQYISRNEIPAAILENEKRVESGKADLADKKPEIKEKIIAGRVDKLMAERCLLDQPFVRDPNTTIAQLLKQKGQTWSCELKPVDFSLYILGDSSYQNTNGSGH
jgi:elongation factor Ts